MSYGDKREKGCTRKNGNCRVLPTPTLSFSQRSSPPSLVELVFGKANEEVMFKAKRHHGSLRKVEAGLLCEEIVTSR